MFTQYFKILTLTLFAVLLTGCATTQKEYITQTKTSLIQTPAPLLQSCSVTKPMARLEYMKKTLNQREEALTDLTVSLYKDLKVCNDQIAEIKGFQDRQLKIVESAQDQK